MKSRSIAMAGAALLAGAVWSQASYASTITIDIWTGQTFGASHASKANVPVTEANFIYTLNTSSGILDFDVPAKAAYTVAEFFATETDGTATCTGGSSGCGAIGTANNLDNALFSITGVTDTKTNATGTTYTVTHDDGASLYIDNEAVITKGGKTSQESSSGTYSGPQGDESFQLVYGETNGLPAVLEATLSQPAVVSTTPLPGALPLLATGLGFIGFLTRRKRKSGAVAMGAA
jgi:hypothetical protein